ncbi:hypothetical protein ACHAP8_010466 [Fusarium lateritium]
MTLPACNDSDVFQEFEIHRRYTNDCLRSYFELLSQFSNENGLPGLLGIPRHFFNGDQPTDLKTIDRTPRETSKILLLKDISTGAVQKLRVLQNIVEEIIKREKPLASSVSPSLLSCMAFFLAVAYALPNPPLSAAFNAGAFVGSAFLTIRFVRKYLQRMQLVPLRHKVRGLIRAFKNGTIRRRDLDEVLISSLD